MTYEEVVDRIMRGIGNGVSDREIEPESAARALAILGNLGAIDRWEQWTKNPDH